MGTVEKLRVTLFLLRFKEIATSGTAQFVFAGNRVENRDTMARLGLRVEQVKEIILTLETEDYYKGPSPDINHTDYEVWIFGRTIDEIDVYIKLQIREIDELTRAICISFHEAEREIRHPFKP